MEFINNITTTVSSACPNMSCLNNVGSFLGKTVSKENGLYIAGQGQKLLGSIYNGLYSGLSSAGQGIANATRPLWDRSAISIVTKDSQTLTTTHQAEALKSLKALKNSTGSLLTSTGKQITGLVSQAQQAAGDVFPEIAEAASAPVHPLLPLSYGTAVVGMIPFAFPYLANLYNSWTCSSELTSFDNECNETWKEVAQLTDEDEITAELVAQNNRLNTAIEERKALADRSCFALNARNVTGFVLIGAAMLALAPQLTLATMAITSTAAAVNLGVCNLWNSYQNSSQVEALEIKRRAFSGEVEKRFELQEQEKFTATLAEKLADADKTYHKLSKELADSKKAFELQKAQLETQKAQFEEEKEDLELEHGYQLQTEMNKVEDLKKLNQQLTEALKKTQNELRLAYATRKEEITARPEFKRQSSFDISTAQSLPPLELAPVTPLITEVEPVKITVQDDSIRPVLVKQDSTASSLEGEEEDEDEIEETVTSEELPSQPKAPGFIEGVFNKVFFGNWNGLSTAMVQ